MNSQIVLNNPFSIDIHKQTFTNYLEVIISDEGEIMYAVPSHQEKLISASCEKLKVSREELTEMCPQEYYFDYMNWLCKVSKCIAVWDKFMVGVANEKQKESLEKLIEEKLYFGTIQTN